MTRTSSKCGHSSITLTLLQPVYCWDDTWHISAGISGEKKTKKTSSHHLCSRLSWALSLFCLHTTSTLTACADCPSTSPCTSASPCRCPWAWVSPSCRRSRLTIRSCPPTRPSHLHGCHLFSVCPGSSHRTDWTRFVWTHVDEPVLLFLSDFHYMSTQEFINCGF